MKKIVIIGANDFQNPLIIKAKEMGFETHVFAWEDGSIGEKTADFFYPISIVEKDEILEKCKAIKPDAIATIASDLASITVQYIAEKLDLPCNPKECIEVSTNKFLMRKAFMENGVSTPKFIETDENFDMDDIRSFKFPIIVKPTDRSGSRGITKLDSKNGVREAIKQATDCSFCKKAIIEEYIDGNEYSCECITYKGKHHFLAVTKKFTSGAPHFIETGQMEPSDLDDKQLCMVKEEIFKALDSLKVQNGPSHSEFKIDSNGELRIIEIGARMGGDCIGSDLVKLSTGKDFLKMTIQVALGLEPDLSTVSEQKIAAIKFIFNKEDLELLKKVKEKYSSKIYMQSQIEEIGSHLITDSGSRYGFYIITSDNIEEVQRLTELW